MKLTFVFVFGLSLVLGQYLRPIDAVLDGLPIASPSIEAVKTRMKLPPMSRIQQFVWYASAPGCSDGTMETWTCGACKLANPDAEFYMSMSNEEFNTRGVIVLDHQLKMVIISFRGTRNIMNILSDANFAPAPFVHSPAKGNWVHAGFLNTMESLSPQFMGGLDRLHESPFYRRYKIGVVGHSLGGAMAVLAAIKIWDVFQIPWKDIEIYTYGQPRTGNRAFVKWFDAQPVTIARVVNYNDFIPHIMGAFVNEMAHHQNEIYMDRLDGNLTIRVCNRNVIEDPTCSNSLPNSVYGVLPHINYMTPSFAHPC